MNIRKNIILLLALMPLAFPSCAPADTTSVTTPVHILVEERNEISILTRSVNIKKEIDGSEERFGFTYRVAITGPRRRRIVARLLRALPSDMTMSMEILTPGKGASEGRKNLSIEPVVLASGLSELGEREGQGTLIFETDIKGRPGTGRAQIILTLEYE